MPAFLEGRSYVKQKRAEHRGNSSDRRCGSLGSVGPRHVDDAFNDGRHDGRGNDGRNDGFDEGMHGSMHGGSVATGGRFSRACHCASSSHALIWLLKCR
jgi:hypothetical protein